MKGKILIVEPEFIIAVDLEMILRRAGFQVAGIVSSAECALRLMSVHAPALVLMEIRLNGKMSGIDLAAKLNEINIPFIYVSCNIAHKTLEEALKTKPSGFVEKPFRESDVLIALAKPFTPGLVASKRYSSFPIDKR